jgi:DNA-binding NarL/FixJ family response regulator
MLRTQVRQNLTAVRDSAATLAINMNATLSGTYSAGTTVLLRSPADAPLLESHSGAAILEAVRETPANAPRQLDAKDQAALDLLTRREIEVLRLIGEGQRTKEIAFTLGITFKTAVTHRSNIMEKLGIHEGPRLVRFAIRTGIATA